LKVIVAQDRDGISIARIVLEEYTQWELEVNLKKKTISYRKCFTSRRSRNLRVKIKECSNFNYLESVFNKTGTNKEDACIIPK
jgi:hypothetical protein